MHCITSLSLPYPPKPQPPPLPSTCSLLQQCVQSYLALLGVCAQVFNRGLEAICLSVDLWLHYLEYMMSQHPDDEAKVRAEFERAVDTCGLEFK